MHAPVTHPTLQPPLTVSIIFLFISVIYFRFFLSFSFRLFFLVAFLAKHTRRLHSPWCTHNFSLCTCRILFFFLASRFRDSFLFGMWRESLIVASWNKIVAGKIGIVIVKRIADSNHRMFNLQLYQFHKYSFFTNPNISRYFDAKFLLPSTHSPTCSVKRCERQFSVLAAWSSGCIAAQCKDVTRT